MKSLVTAAGYHCRTRNHVPGALLSQHAFANALDIRAVRLADGRELDLTDRSVAKTLRERVKERACGRFTTVLGPESDGFHESHIHLDLAERRSGYRLCQWAVLAPGEEAPKAPAVAAAPAAGPSTGAITGTMAPSIIPMPAPRPRDAVAAAPRLKPLPDVLLGEAAAEALPKAPPRSPDSRSAAPAEPPKLAAAAPATPRPRPVAARSASKRAARAGPRAASRPRARAPRPAAPRLFEDLRAIFRW